MSTVLRIILLLPLLHGAVGKTPASLDCEKRCHPHFTPSQKEQLCADAPLLSSPSGGGPAACAAVAKDQLRLPFDEILRLCQRATGPAPGHCVLTLRAAAAHSASSPWANYKPPPINPKRPLPTHTRGIDPLALCGGANTTLPARCALELLAYTGRDTLSTSSLTAAKHHAPPAATPQEAITAYCRDVDDVRVSHRGPTFYTSFRSSTPSSRHLSWHLQVAALQCVDAAVAVLQLSPAQALAPCRNAASAFWDDNTATDPKASAAAGGLTQHPIATCLRELKPHLKTGDKGLGATDAAAYCAQAALFRPPPPPAEPDTGKEANANATGGAVPAGKWPTEPLVLCFLSTEPPSAVAQVSIFSSMACVIASLAAASSLRLYRS